MQGLNTVWAQFSQGWLGIGPIYVHLRILLITFYWTWQVLIIIRSGKIKGAQYLLSENRNIITWAIVFCASQVIFFLPYYINLISGNQVNSFFVNYGLIAVGIGLTMVYLILHPAILYGLKGIFITQSRQGDFEKQFHNDDKGVNNAGPSFEIEKPARIKKEQAANPNDPVYMSGQNLSMLATALTAYLEKEKPYLKKNCTSAVLAGEMKIQPYVLSAVINQVFKTNFNDFLNEYCVLFAKELIQNGEAKHLQSKDSQKNAGSIIETHLPMLLKNIRDRHLLRLSKKSMNYNFLSYKQRGTNNLKILASECF